MFLFLYNFAWTLAVMISLPLILLLKNQRVSERLCLDLPDIILGEKRIWVHALSVGEVISAIPLVKAIRLRYPSISIIFTVKTFQGMEVARRELKGEVNSLIPMPVDFWWSVSRLFHHISPTIFILVESDIWPGLLSYLKKRDIKILLVNGRISPHTFMSYKRFRFIARQLLKEIDLYMMQSEIDRDRLIEIGIYPQKIKNTGNIKFDRAWRSMDAGEYYYHLKVFNLQPQNMVWIAGSTHQGEDEIILETFKRLRDYFPELFLIIAPRRIESADNIFRMSAEKGINAKTRSSLDIYKAAPYEALILDTIGELERIYGIAHIAFVGGSMVPIGGHNILEPASFGCPVLFGEYTHNFLVMSQLLVEAGGGFRVKDGEDLFLKMKLLISDNGLRNRMGSMAKDFVLKNSGSIDRVMSLIGGYIDRHD